MRFEVMFRDIAIGVIVHGDVEQIEERESWSALELQEPPEALLAFLAQVFLGNCAENSEIESDRPARCLPSSLSLRKGCLRQYVDRMLPTSKFGLRKRASVRSKYISGSYSR